MNRWKHLIGVLFCGVLGTAACDSTETDMASPDAGAVDTEIAKTFTVRIENLSAGTTSAGPFAPGVWALHQGDNPLFVSGEVASVGLEQLAEDGMPSGLHDSITEVLSKGVVSMPEGSTEAGPLLPGAVYEFSVDALASEDPRLSLAAMLVKSNDTFAALQDIALFDEDGVALTGDVSDMLQLWESGSEQNQVPGGGPDQPIHGGGAIGAAEGVIREFSDTTRAVPVASQIASVSVTESGGVFTVTLRNVGDVGGQYISPLAPAFWSSHAESWAFFGEGVTDDGMGLEVLAEDGSPAALVASYSSDANASVGAMAMPAAGGDPGPIGPGGSYVFDITPSTSQRFLSVASMVVASNDMFLATAPGGVALLEADGTPRSAAQINSELLASVALWDAGTEENQVPGAGTTQPMIGGPDSGPVDDNSMVRRYHDITNDLVSASEMLGIEVTDEGEGVVKITLTNHSPSTGYATPFAPANYVLHDDTVSYFGDGVPASAGLELLAEDGDASMMTSGQAARTGVSVSETVGDGPLMGGQSYQFTLTPDATHRFANFALMAVKSNDTFFSLLPEGVELMSAGGQLRPIADIQSDMQAALRAWDAGTEANQSGAVGADQPLHGGGDVGMPEGSGLVRAAGGVWTLPEASQLLRVTVSVD